MTCTCDVCERLQSTRAANEAQALLEREAAAWRKVRDSYLDPQATIGQTCSIVWAEIQEQAR
jgi:hypothetical protein